MIVQTRLVLTLLVVVEQQEEVGGKHSILSILRL
jgi:hypothetical protein